MAKELQFYDVKAKKKFKSTKWKTQIRGARKFAVVKSPLSGIMSWRVLGKA